MSGFRNFRKDHHSEFKTATAMHHGCGLERFITVGGDTSNGDGAASIAICKIFLDKREAKEEEEGRGVSKLMDSRESFRWGTTTIIIKMRLEAGFLLPSHPPPHFCKEKKHQAVQGDSTRHELFCIFVVF